MKNNKNLKKMKIKIILQNNKKKNFLKKIRMKKINYKVKH